MLPAAEPGLLGRGSSSEGRDCALMANAFSRCPSIVQHPIPTVSTERIEKSVETEVDSTDSPQGHEGVKTLEMDKPANQRCSSYLWS